MNDPFLTYALLTLILLVGISIGWVLKEQHQKTTPKTVCAECARLLPHTKKQKNVITNRIQ